MIEVTPGTTIYPVIEADTGLVGTIAIRVENIVTGAVVVARRTTFISEIAPGEYRAILADIIPSGQHLILWDLGDPSDPAGTFSEELFVQSSPSISSSPSSYADVAAVKARAGVLADAWDDTTKVKNADLQRFLDEGAAEINARIGAYGFAVPVTDAIAVASLTGWNADLALSIALAATWPGGTGPETVSDTLRAVQGRLTAYTAALDKGGLAAIAYLRAQEANGASGAANFWTTEQDYSPWLDDIASGAIVDYGGGLIIRGPLGPQVHKDFTRF